MRLDDETTAHSFMLYYIERDISFHSALYSGVELSLDGHSGTFSIYIYICIFPVYVFGVYICTYDVLLEKCFPLQGERAHALLWLIQSSYPA